MQLDAMEPAEIALLEEDDWFGALPSGRRRLLLQHARIMTVERDRHVYRLGDAPNGLYALLHGEMRMVSYSATGLEIVAMVLRPGLWFGELSVIDGKPRPHDAITTTPVRLAQLSMPVIASLTAADPEMWRDIAMLGCAHQRMAMRHSERVRTQPAIARLAGFLLGKALASADMRIPMTQDRLADVVGVSRQRINPLLKELTALGITRPGYRSVEICDLAGLKQFLDRHQ